MSALTALNVVGFTTGIGEASPVGSTEATDIETRIGLMINVTADHGTQTIAFALTPHQARLVAAALTETTGPPTHVCPECRDGKHPNCAHQALDEQTDTIVDSCDCPDLHHLNDTP